MEDLAERLAHCARCAGVSLESVHRLHLLQGVVRHWARSPYADDLVLGGSLLTQQWVGLSRRTARDLDFVGLYPHDLGATLDRFRAILAGAAADGILCEVATLRGEITWQEMRFPGTRVVFGARLLGRASELQIDVGFGYSLTPPAWRIEYPCLVGGGVSVQALRPELLVAWKLDGLFERGRRRWLPKGLFDIYLLTKGMELDRELLRAGIRSAFAAKAIPLESILGVLYHRAWWEKPASRNKWARFRATCAYPVPEDLVEVAAQVARALRPSLEGLLAFPAERTWPGTSESVQRTDHL